VNAEEGLCGQCSQLSEGDDYHDNSSLNLVLEEEKSFAKYADADGRAVLTYHQVKVWIVDSTV